MKHLIRKCPACGAYSLSHECPNCKAATIDPHPPRYSPDDKYVRYRVAERYADDSGGDKDYK
jgi:H/ACA ribonucleoprotein complex subunit 3